VLAIDKRGESALIQMITEGASLVATRAYMKDLLARLQENRDETTENA
jgi:hypothetical protein